LTKKRNTLYIHYTISDSQVMYDRRDSGHRDAR